MYEKIFFRNLAIYFCHGYSLSRSPLASSFSTRSTSSFSASKPTSSLAAPSWQPLVKKHNKPNKKSFTKFIFLAFSYYGWISVAAFYSQLKDKETDEDLAEDYSQEGRSEIFMRPPPPPYTISYENPLAYEKPPPYEEGVNRY